MSITEKEINHLKSMALRAREHIIKMSSNGGCFLGASLSCVDIIVYLYNQFLNIRKDNLNDPGRDYLFLSKGHDVPALYSVFAEMGIINSDRLKNHCSTDDDIYWHPNRNIPGVEYYSGSLGHLLSVAMGVAIDCKIREQSNKIIVILGDGELNEGSVWESSLVASAKKLDNLVAIVDRNLFQANVRTESLIPLEPLELKFEAFGWKVHSIDGHSFQDMHDVFSEISNDTGTPNVVIADTIRGKGLASIEERADRWFCKFTNEEIDDLLLELHGAKMTDLISETLTVR